MHIILVFFLNYYYFFLYSLVSLVSCWFLLEEKRYKSGGKREVRSDKRVNESREGKHTTSPNVTNGSLTR